MKTTMLLVAILLLNVGILFTDLFNGIAQTDLPTWVVIMEIILILILIVDDFLKSLSDAYEIHLGRLEIFVITDPAKNSDSSSEKSTPEMKKTGS